jgi:tRNA(fMet)-specific endonuclease VapC
LTYLIDTNACIAILNGTDTQLRDRLNEIGPLSIALCSVVLGELLFGARNSAKIQFNLERVHGFASGLTSLPYDAKAAEFYGITRAILERAGTRIGEADLMIASIALAHDLIVITRNKKEFARVPGLRMESW